MAPHSHTFKPKPEFQLAIYKFIVRFKRENDGCSPSLRQIATHMGTNSTSEISAYLRSLKALGLIELGPTDQARMIKLVGGSYSAPSIPLSL